MFDLQLVNPHWLDGADPEADQCAHGRVRASADGESLTSEQTDLTVSAAALHLMRTVLGDYKPGTLEAQLLPCCGFAVYPAEDGDRATIIGCNIGGDWEVRHSANGQSVVLVSATGRSTEISIREYARAVVAFADRVEAFYRASAPKREPADVLERDGWSAFWREWRALHEECSRLLRPVAT